MHGAAMCIPVLSYSCFRFSQKSSEIIDSDLSRKLLKATTLKKITMVTAGCSDAGKSTFIANMLGLTCATCTGQRSRSDTGHVKSYARGSQIKIVDIPSMLGKSEENETDIIVELQIKNNGKADILLYCLSLRRPTKDIITKEDKATIKKLTLYFGTDIWKHAILVLTDAHELKRKYKPTFQDLIKKHAEAFQSILNGYCPPDSNFSVVSIISSAQVQRDPCTIIAVPIGQNRYQELEEGTRWIDSIHRESQKKCAHPPQLLTAKTPDGWFKSKQKKIANYAILGSTVGVTTGGSVGGAGGAVFAGVGTILGAAIGVATGATIGGGIGALVGGVAAIFNSEEGQSKLQKVQEAIEKKKNK